MSIEQEQFTSHIDTPEVEDLRELQQPLAVIALRQSDCTLSTINDDSEDIQQQIITRGLQEAMSYGVPLIVPKGLEQLVESTNEVELVPVKSRSNAKKSMKATRKYFYRASSLFDRESEEAEDEGIKPKEKPVVVVAHRVSYGAIRRHCDYSGISIVGLIDLYRAEDSE